MKAKKKIRTLRRELFEVATRAEKQKSILIEVQLELHNRIGDLCQQVGDLKSQLQEAEKQKGTIKFLGNRVRTFREQVRDLQSRLEEISGARCSCSIPCQKEGVCDDRN